MGIPKASAQSEFICEIESAIQIQRLCRGILAVRQNLWVIVEVKRVTEGLTRRDSHIDKAQHLSNREYCVILLVKDATHPIEGTV